ncbi:uncharacterized protein LOC141903243 [Tubulanus polymorphus]|uniref:uncharacterized protein LOC141903243 n=1 Tax=Tubulanus polymorphus TaxID=672921 RepID=UPI003DA29E32
MQYIFVMSLNIIFQTRTTAHNSHQPDPQTRTTAHNSHQPDLETRTTADNSHQPDPQASNSRTKASVSCDHMPDDDKFSDTNPIDHSEKAHDSAKKASSKIHLLARNCGLLFSPHHG